LVEMVTITISSSSYNSWLMDHAEKIAAALGKMSQPNWKRLVKIHDERRYGKQPAPHGTEIYIIIQGQFKEEQG